MENVFLCRQLGIPYDLLSSFNASLSVTGTKAEADVLGVNVRPFKSLTKLLLAILVWSRSHP